MRSGSSIESSGSPYTQLLEAIPDAALIVNRVGEIVLVNLKATAMFGYQRGELTGQSLQLLVPEAARSHHARDIDRYFASPHVRPLHTGLMLSGRRRDGSEFPVDIMLSPIVDGGEPFALGVIRDNTTTDWSQLALQQSETRYQSLFENMLDGAAYCRMLFDEDQRPRDFIYLDVNRAFERLTGLKNVVGKRASEVIPGLLESNPELFEIYGRVALTGQPERFEVRVEPLGAIWLSISAYAVEREYFVAVFDNITERKQADEALGQERNLLRTLIDNLPDAIYVKDRASRFVIKNLADARKMGAATPDETIGKTDFDYYPADLAARYQADDQAVIESGQAILNREEPIIEATGRTGWVSTTKVPLRDGHGQVIGLVGIGHDITERKRAERELERRVQQFAMLYEAGLALTRAMEPGAQLKAILKIASQAVHAEGGHFFDYDAARENLSLAIGYPDESIPNTLRGVRFALGQPEGLVGWVGQQRASLSLADVQSDPRWVPYDPQINSAIMVPLFHEERLLGVFSMISTRRDAFSLDDQLLLELFAAQAAVALDNTRLFAETRQRLRELEAVNRVSTAMRAAQTLDQLLTEWLDVTLDIAQASGGSLWLYDSVRDELQPALLRGWAEPPGAEPVQPLKPGQGINGHVFVTGQPYVSANFRDDPLTTGVVRERIPQDGGVCVPIRAGDQVIGTFVIYLSQSRPATPDEVQLITTLTEIAGTAIQRTLLHEQTERRLQNLAALHEIDLAITASPDLRTTLTVLLEQVVKQLGVHAADVLLLEPNSLTLQYAAGRGFHTQEFQHVQVRVGEGRAGRVALERRMAVVLDPVTIDPPGRRTRSLQREGFVSYLGVPLIVKGQVLGVLELFHRAPLQTDSEWLQFLEALAVQAAIAMDNTRLFDHLQQANQDLVLAYDATIEGWSAALDLRDHETEGHTQRVTDLTERLARAIGFRAEELVHIRRGALLHDIGKMGIPDAILLKPGPLTDEEWAIMRLHPTHAYRLLAPIKFLRLALEIPYCHHEKWDGTGYPRGLKGDQIPLAARVFAVVDVWDALRSDRPYRAAWPEDRVREYIQTQAGTHFDPQIVKVALDTSVFVQEQKD